MILGRILKKAFSTASRPLKLARMRQLGMTFYAPNYVYFDNFTSSSIVADVGCGYEAEFSRHMIDRHGLRAFAVDPTRKHAPSLVKLQQHYAGRFTHLPLAVSARTGTLVFHESKQNESGSLLPEHTNVRHDDTTSYEVESVSLLELTKRLGSGTIDLLKLDLEGAEYDLFDGATAETLRPFRQIFLECHHHCTEHTIDETKRLVGRVASLGFNVFTLDEHNFLFYR